MKLRLLRALARGPLRTGDLDEAVLGFLYLPGVLNQAAIAPYGYALAELIHAHRVVWWIADNGDVWYALRPKLWNIIAWWRLADRGSITGGKLNYEP